MTQAKHLRYLGWLVKMLNRRKLHARRICAPTLTHLKRILLPFHSPNSVLPNSAFLLLPSYFLASTIALVPQNVCGIDSAWLSRYIAQFTSLLPGSNPERITCSGAT